MLKVGFAQNKDFKDLRKILCKYFFFTKRIKYFTGKVLYIVTVWFYVSNCSVGVNMKTKFHLSMVFLSAYFMHILHERVSNSLPFIVPSSSLLFAIFSNPHI